MDQSLIYFQNIIDNSEYSFIVSECNIDAFNMVNKWPKWESFCLVISGPGQCGKTHLCNIWKEKSNAIFINNENQLFDIDDSNNKKNRNYIIEDFTDMKEESLFHIYNHVRDCSGYLLLSSRLSPAYWNFDLPDLKSRIMSEIFVDVKEPDDNLIVSILMKQFSDRQLRVTKNVIEYMLPRMERSFLSISDLVNKLDRKSLEYGKNITIPFVKDVLFKTGSPFQRELTFEKD